MTRKETIECLEEMQSYFKFITGKRSEVIDNAIQALKAPQEWLKTFNTESAPQCFNAVQELKKKIEEEEPKK